MKLYIRADADASIGIGHVMRCIVLAQFWRDQGGSVTFISRCENEVLRQRIQKESFNLITLNRVYNESVDVKYALTVLNKIGYADLEDWFVLDGYHFTDDYQKAIHDSGINLLVIDDMNHLPVYNADIIINQNIHAQKLTYNCGKNTIILRGTDYVFLRQEFLKYGKIKRDQPRYARNVLVTLGGADPDNVTIKVIRAIDSLGKLPIKVTIVIGPTNLHTESIQYSLELTKLDYSLLVNPSNMAELMAAADLAISAGGNTYWELAYMGVPCIMIILAENQRGVANELAKLGAVINLGCSNFLSCNDIATAINSIIVSKHRRMEMGEKGQDMIDGNGASRIINAMQANKRKKLILQ